jgi:hypothetical protein
VFTPARPSHAAAKMGAHIGWRGSISPGEGARDVYGVSGDLGEGCEWWPVVEGDVCSGRGGMTKRGGRYDRGKRDNARYVASRIACAALENPTLCLGVSSSAVIGDQDTNPYIHVARPGSPSHFQAVRRADDDADLGSSSICA